MEIGILFLSISSLFGIGSGALESAVAQKFFVDRSRFIKIFYDFHIHPERPLFVSAPSGSGKSSLVDMMARYFRVELRGVSGSSNIDRNRTAAYRLFTSGYRGRAFAVANETYFFDQHIAKYPVVKLDFATLDATNYHKLIRDASVMIRQVYSTYPNVTSRLNDPEMQPGGSELAGFNLTRDLHEYFKEKCVILVDSLDHPAATLLDTSTPDAFKIQTWLAGFLDRLLKNNDHLEAGFLTGRSRLGEVYAPNNTNYRSFVNSKSFALTFGLSSEQVTDLLSRYKSKLSYDQLARAFCGYRTNATDIRVFPTASVVRSIESGRVVEGWQPGVSTERFSQAFRLDAAGGYILNALRGGAIVLILSKRVQYSDLEELRVYLDGVNDKKFEYRQRSTPLFLQYLYELGYFTNTFEELGGYANLRVPNLEIAHHLKALFMKALTGEFIFNTARLTRLKDSIQELSESKKFQAFLDAARAVVTPYLSDVRLREYIVVILFHAVRSAMPEVLQEVLVPGGVGVDDRGVAVGYFRGFADTLVIPGRGTAVVINHKVGATAFDALKQVFERGYDKLSAEVSRWVFIGLSFDVVSKQLSASFLRDSRNCTLAYNITV